MPPSDPSRLGYQRSLDGLRAVAVVAVFGYHAGISWLPGGFLGVDAFFVISGFLITTLLVQEWDGTGGIALRSFWARRIRRLFPALVLFLLGVAAYAAVVAAPVARRGIRLDGLAALFYVANWRFVWSQQSYFEALAGPSPLRHTWSLAVEEQWYLLWPLVAWAALRVRRGRRNTLVWLAAVTLGLAAGSAWWMAHLVPPAGDPSRAYYGTDTRAQALLVGAAVALLWCRWPVRSPWMRRVLAGGGVAGLIVGGALFVVATERSLRMYHGGFAVAAVAWALVVVATLDAVGGPVHWLCRRRPLVALGRISYGVYLWQWPVILTLTSGRTHLHGFALWGLQGAVSVGVAAVSYRLVEQPIRHGRWRRAHWWRPAPLFGAGVAVGVVALLLGTLGAVAPPPDNAAGAAPGVAEKVSKVTLVPQTAPDLAPPGLSAPSGAPSPAPVGADRPVKVVVLGDSVGFDLAYYAPPIQGLQLTTYAIPGCGILPGVLQIGDVRRLPSEHCPDLLAEWRRAVTDQADVALVFIGGWEVFDPWVDGRRLKVGTPAWHRYLTDRLQEGIDVLTEGTTMRVGLATVPCYRFDEPVLGIPSTERNEARRSDAVDAVVREVAARNPGRVALVDWAGYACPGGTFRERAGGVVLRPDGMHTDVPSTSVVWEWLAPIALAIAHRNSL